MFKTRDKDYTDCQPDIAEALKSGKEILCRVGNAGEIDYVIDYMRSDTHHYIVGRFFAYKTATPVEVKQRVKKASDIVKWLEDNGYEVIGKGPGGSRWDHPDKMSFSSEMFYYCGKAPSKSCTWLPEWLDEVTE